MDFITIKDNKVVSTRQGETIVEGEIENIDNLQCGMELIDGVWQLPVPVPQPKLITMEDLKENQLILMDVIATMYEDMMAKGTV